MWFTISLLMIATSFLNAFNIVVTRKKRGDVMNVSKNVCETRFKNTNFGSVCHCERTLNTTFHQIDGNYGCFSGKELNNATGKFLYYDFLQAICIAFTETSAFTTRCH